VAVDANRKNGIEQLLSQSKTRSDITRWCVPA
jgi:hypothetical protein